MAHSTTGDISRNDISSISIKSKDKEGEGDNEEDSSESDEIKIPTEISNIYKQSCFSFKRKWDKEMGKYNWLELNQLRLVKAFAAQEEDSVFLNF